MKKLFTLIAFLTCFLGAKAETVVDVDLTFADATEAKYNAWGMVEGATLDIEDGYLHYHADAAGANAWDTQFFLNDINFDVQLGATYTIALKIKGTEGPWWNISFAGQDKYNTFTVTEDWQELSFEYANVEGDRMPLFQCGSYVGDWYIEYIKITHEKAEGQKEPEWKDNMLVNGDAESAWPEWSLAETDGVNANWRGAKATEISVWSLTMGRNYDEESGPTGDTNRARPFPCDIEDDPDKAGNHIFAVHCTEIAPIDDFNDDTDDAGSIAWSNQFFIMAPKGFKSGTQAKVSFRYKASMACTVPTQVHHENPSWYLHYTGSLGDINFTDEWQTFEKVVTFNGWSGNDLGYCVAFNLNNDEAARTAPIDFYFDDITWQEMDLQEGWFAAAINTNEEGAKYDTDNAIEFTPDKDETGADIFVATVGAKDAYVNEVMISTVYGFNNAFLANTIQLADGATINAESVETWILYEDAGSAKIKLVPGIWKIEVDPGETMVRFTEIEGETLKAPIDITTNESELKIEGVERNWTSGEASAEGFEEELPEGYAYGNGWDNQFWIVANRGLDDAGTVVIEFDYYLISDDVTEAKVTTQSHGANCNYIYYSAIGDITFTPEEQHFSKELTYPLKDWQGTVQQNLQSIAFNMAEIKQACTYVIKNIKWYVKYTEDGKTTENLIDAEGTDNFWVKIGAGNRPYNWTKGDYPFADVNGDYVVDALDIMDTITLMCNDEYSKFADLNDDKVVDALDIQDMITIICNQ